MAKSKVSGFRQASAKEVRELLKLPWVRDEELSAGVPGTDARLLPDGRVLLFMGDGERGPLYPSRESLAEVQRQCRAMPTGPVDATLTLLPPIDDFLRDVEVHAKSLGPRLRIADGVLDGSVASLGAVDKALGRVPRAERQVADLMTPLVAYVGEVFRRASGGRWIKPPPTVEHPRTSSRNKPVVVASNGQSFDPFSDLFIWMVEPSKRNPPRATVESRLHGAGYPQAPKPTA